MVAIRAWIPALVVLVIAPRAQERVPHHLLRLSPGPAVTEFVRIRQDLDSSATINGFTQTQRVRMEIFWRTSTQHGDDGNKRVVHTLYRFRAAGIDHRGDAYHYDSATGATPHRSIKEVGQMLGGEVVVEVDAEGRTTGVTLPEAMQRVDDSSGVTFIRASEMLRPSPLVVPELPVAVGGTWGGPEPLGGGEGSSSTYRLLGVDAGVAEIEHHVVVVPKTKDEAQQGKRISNRFYVDLSSGRVREMRGETTIRAAERPSPRMLDFTMQREQLPDDAAVEESLDRLQPPAAVVPIAPTAVPTSRPSRGTPSRTSPRATEGPEGRGQRRARLR